MYHKCITNIAKSTIKFYYLIYKTCDTKNGKYARIAHMKQREENVI